MSPDDFETVYEALASALDTAGPEKHALFLTKVVLMLADASGEPEKVQAAFRDCLEDL